jgi:signal transduction histidine kinase
MPDGDTQFARLVSLACHDLRTPLATVHGFARTLTQLEGVDDRIAGYLGMIETASVQLADLLDDLGLAARIEGRRWEPNLRTADLLELAGEGTAELGEAVGVSGPGGPVRVDVDAARRAVDNLARCALRHGGLDRLDLVADGTGLRFSPVGAEVAPIALGIDLRDLGAAVAVRVVEALGGSVRAEGEALVVRLPSA